MEHWPMDSGNMIFISMAGIIPLLWMAYFLGRRKAFTGLKEDGAPGRLHSRPLYYGWYAVIRMTAPALAVALVFALAHLAGGYEVPGTMLLSAALIAAAGGLWTGLRLINPDFRARGRVERTVRWLLVAASMVSIFTTIGIVLAVIVEAIRFFHIVSLWDFITGTTWNPDAASSFGQQQDPEGLFGSVPIFAGTFMITAIAMLVAVPIGLLSAIYMSEFASYRVRNVAKPALEVLAGIPTVVYGFFAAVTVSPLIVHAAEAVGLEADYTNALAPGMVMGIMIIPFISSLSDDIIRAVPQSIRNGSLALGTTHTETISKIVLPAALPGIVSAFLLGVSRALGETMIVVMAAGLRPNLTWNPLEGMTTVTVRIVDALTGDQAFDSPETLSAFGLGLALLVVTLTLNIASTIVIRRFRQKYE